MTLSPNNSLSTFKNFDTFHFFYFSRKEDKTYLLLSSKQSQSFSHITGSVNQYDPGIFFTAGRKVIDISYGLLAPQNLEYFKDGSMFPIVSRDMLQFCKPNLQTVSIFIKSFSMLVINLFSNNSLFYILNSP